MEPLCVFLVVSQLGKLEGSSDLGHKDLSPKTLTYSLWRGQLHFKWPNLVSLSTWHCHLVACRVEGHTPDSLRQ